MSTPADPLREALPQILRDAYENALDGQSGWPWVEVAHAAIDALAAEPAEPAEPPPGVNAEAWKRLGITNYSALAYIRNDEELRLYVQACIEEAQGAAPPSSPEPPGSRGTSSAARSGNCEG